MQEKVFEFSLEHTLLFQGIGILKVFVAPNEKKGLNLVLHWNVCFFFNF